MTHLVTLGRLTIIFVYKIVMTVVIGIMVRENDMMGMIIIINYKVIDYKNITGIFST